MIRVGAIVLYKNTAAEVVSFDEKTSKYTVKYRTPPAGKKSFETQSVREKDIKLLCADGSPIEDVLEFANSISGDSANEVYSQIKECYELLSSDESVTDYSFEDLVSLFRGSLKGRESWGLYCALCASPYFSQKEPLVFSVRTKDEINEIEQKEISKQREKEERAAFIERLKTRKLLDTDSIYMGDVEALALGKTEKSRTMQEAHIKETPEDAHRLLLETGIWDITRNPYPVRWGLSMKSAAISLESPPDEERVTPDHTAFAIDNAWSEDPDDAVFFDGTYLWVHIADPASTVKFDSAIEKSACERGATLYIPEGAARMLSETCLSDYALGLSELSRALSFRISLDDDANVTDCAVFKTLVKVKRLTYEEADSLCESPDLKSLFDIASRYSARRLRAGAVSFDLPEVHISVDRDTKQVAIQNPPRTKSADMIKEMMILAGEACARFAFKNAIPFPFVTQEAPEIPADLPPGLAGKFRLRRCMKRRSVGVTPGFHSGLGLAMYTQVTSPLRRYGDLLSHIQLRAFLNGERLQDKDTVLMRAVQGNEGAVAAKKAERKSNLHWTLVYLLQNPGWEGEAICVDKLFKAPLFSVPSLAVETYIPCSDKIALNDTVKVKVQKIDIPTLSLEFKIIE